MISADNPNSSADTPISGSSDERSAGWVVGLPARSDMSWPSPRVFPGDDLVDVEPAKADSLSFCLNKVSSSSVPTQWRHNGVHGELGRRSDSLILFSNFSYLLLGASLLGKTGSFTTRS